MTQKCVATVHARVFVFVSDLLKVPAGAATDGEQPVLIKTWLLIIGRLWHNEVTERLHVAEDIRTSGHQSRSVLHICVELYVDVVAVALR